MLHSVFLRGISTGNFAQRGRRIVAEGMHVQASQPGTSCCDSRLRQRWQRDRDARASRRVQRAV